MTEKEKMLKGELYQSFGKELTEERLRVKSLKKLINYKKLGFREDFPS